MDILILIIVCWLLFRRSDGEDNDQDKDQNNYIFQAPPMRLGYRPGKPIPTVEKSILMSRLDYYAKAFGCPPLDKLERELEIAPNIRLENGQLLILVKADQNGRLEPHLVHRHRGKGENVVGYWADGTEAIVFCYDADFTRATGWVEASV